ncbi:uncharacterized protein LY89DRAFT_743943 [Mollisia scopiformis]|uniref:Uncharacterized protein n=1 Tax=Mollisia scopiformis TaxID=149040 RepID=A0A132B1T2_MOLSC|nr:uncharacterized protein LY89DRAFT_743943 [Mollisia scopiformis]KUJ06332.1 hypothetical protein LY89DRAFT_743943 [Mollisia scopiformis]
MFFNYPISLTLGVAYVSAVVGAKAFIAADRAIQQLNPRAEYQGGWPLALSALNTTCPAEAPVQCNNGEVNPSCCPAGQFCVWPSGLFAFACCPTADSCLVAVTNFPRCANTSWNMFDQGGSYFCCEPGQLGVNPKTGLPDGLCEPADQPVPTSLLASIATQIGGATATSVASNATQAGVPNQTNPSLPNTSTDSSGNVINTISHWSLGRKIGVGAAVVIAFVIFLVVASLIRRRRARLAYQYEGFNQYDEYGNLIQQTGYRPGYEPYRRTDGGTANNVTVNVVHGDQSS